MEQIWEDSHICSVAPEMLSPTALETGSDSSEASGIPLILGPRIYPITPVARVEVHDIKQVSGSGPLSECPELFTESLLVCIAITVK